MNRLRTKSTTFPTTTACAFLTVNSGVHPKRKNTSVLTTAPSLEFSNETERFHVLEKKGLSSREIEVFGWVVQGKTNPEIGMIMDIRANTAAKHLENIYRKFEVGSRTALVVKFFHLLLEGTTVKNF